VTNHIRSVNALKRQRSCHSHKLLYTCNVNFSKQKYLPKASVCKTAAVV